MDAATRAVYEAGAERWRSARTPRNLDQAARLAGRSAGPCVDLGCGPGFHSSALPAPVVALDCAKAMLDLLPQAAPFALRVQADLGALPFRRGSLGAAWAHHSYVHLPRADVPMALAHLHWSLRPGAAVCLRMFGGAGEEGEPFADDDFPGRFFALWPPEELQTVVERAGFSVDSCEVERGSRGDIAITISAVRSVALPDYVRRGLRVLCVGLNPSIHAAEAGVGFVTGSNRFWSAAVDAGLVTRARDPWGAVADGVGFTDVAKRPTARAAEIGRDEFVTGYAALERLVSWLSPGVVMFIGLAAWRAAVDRRAEPGPQQTRVGGRPAFVLPSTSGLNARCSQSELVSHMRAALELMT